MRYGSLLALVAGAVILGGAPRVAGQLVAITASGGFDFIAPNSPDFAPPWLSLSYSLRVDATPVWLDGAAHYTPVTARLEVGDQLFPLVKAEFIVLRFESGPFAPRFGYLLAGETVSGMTFTLFNSSRSPSYAADFSIPQSLPSATLLAHDVTLWGPQRTWVDYGDGTLNSVRLVSAPEPAVMGALAGLLLAVFVIYRSVHQARPQPGPGPAA